MRLSFLNRENEIDRVERALQSKHPEFIVLYGRRRCGKSRLLRELSIENLVYFVADNSEFRIQIQNLAKEIGRIIQGFDQADYTTWQSFFANLIPRIHHQMCLILDEFPHLVQNSPELPSIVQNLIDDPKNRLNLIICGSSQRMMQGIVLEADAPLYGRATEIIKLNPLDPKWIGNVFSLSAIESIEMFSVWGGIPRYWELAKGYPDLFSALKNLVFDPNGVLYNEPVSLLRDDMQRTAQSHTLLSIIAAGNHRLSKIASKIGKPASSLTRPLSNLVELGYIKRELPFGESIRSTKRSLYKIADPFLNFWYKYIPKNRSLLEQDCMYEVMKEMWMQFPLHVSEVWEELARYSVRNLDICGIQWKPAQRWWGKGIDGTEVEIDILAESFDKQYLLVGEAKWEERSEVTSLYYKLRKTFQNIRVGDYPNVIYGLWLKKIENKIPEDFPCSLFLPEDIL